MIGELLRTTLMWIAALSSILGLFFYLLDRFNVLNVVPWLTGGLLGLAILAAVILAISEVASKKDYSVSKQPDISISEGAAGIFSGRDVIQSPITIGETPELKKQRLEESLSALSDELLSILQSLASQINWTVINRPEGPNIPRRPGETRAHFEDRARDEFARWIEYLASGYQQFPLSDVTYTAQKVNISGLTEPKRQAAENAYAAVREARNRVFLYREYLKNIIDSVPNDTDRRIKKANKLKDETVNALTSHWFDILGNWLLMDPDQTNLQVVQDIILPQVAEEENLPKLLNAGPVGWKYTRLQLARLTQEKVNILAENTLNLSIEKGNQNDSQTLSRELSKNASELVSEAGLAYMEGSPRDALRLIQEALQLDVNEDQRHFLSTSLNYLKNPEQFDGVLGAYIMKINSFGAAAQAGLSKGDVIIRYNNQLVTEPIELSKMIPMTRDAPVVPIEALRDGKRITKYIKGGSGLAATATTLVVAIAVSL